LSGHALRRRNGRRPADRPITWCVTGPLRPPQDGFKDLRCYSAQAWEGLVRQWRPGVKLRIGMRYFFQPRMGMLQWRHSGLLNFMSRTPGGIQVRLEGLWIGWATVKGGCPAESPGARASMRLTCSGRGCTVKALCSPGLWLCKRLRGGFSPAPATGAGEQGGK
jgi:hypothetical protein